MCLRSGCSLNNLCFGTEAACGQVPRLYRQRPDNNKKRVKKTSQAQADSPTCLRHYTIRWKRASRSGKKKTRSQIGHLFDVCVICFGEGLIVFRKSWGS